MVQRLLIWFKNPEDNLYPMTIRFTGISKLLNRLVNKSYKGKKVKFLNLYFGTKSHYEQYPQIELNFTHAVKDVASFNGLLNIDFKDLDIKKQKRIIWEKACNALKKVAKDTKNHLLFESVDTAYKIGLEQDLNENYKILSQSFGEGKKRIVADLWAIFEKDEVSSLLKVQQNNQDIINRKIDTVRADCEFFYEMYKSIIIDEENNLVLKGHYDVEYLPMKFSME